MGELILERFRTIPHTTFSGSGMRFDKSDDKRPLPGLGDAQDWCSAGDNPPGLDPETSPVVIVVRTDLSCVLGIFTLTKKKCYMNVWFLTL